MESQTHGESDCRATHGMIWLICDQAYVRRLRATPPHMIPVSNVDLAVDGNSDVVRDVVLTDI